MDSASSLSPRQTTYLTFRAVSLSNSVLLYAALAVLVADVSIWALTFAPSPLDVPNGIFAPFFAFAIAAGGVSVVMQVWIRGRRSGRAQITLKQFSNVQRTMLIALLVLIFLTAIMSFAVGVTAYSSHGQPGYNAATNQYYFKDHGSVTLTTRATYLSALAKQTRAFISVAMLFTFVSILLLDQIRRELADFEVPTFARLPTPTRQVPKWNVRTPPALLLIATSMVIATIGCIGITGRVNRSLANPAVVTRLASTQHLTAGPKVVFVFCETKAIEAPYGCPEMTPSDIVIRSLNNHEALATHVDPSTDHISPQNLPAAGKLTFFVHKAGDFEVKLTRRIPKDVFIAESPGSISQSALISIAMTGGGLCGLFTGSLLLVLRLRWRTSAAPLISLPTN